MIFKLWDGGDSWNPLVYPTYLIIITKINMGPKTVAWRVDSMFAHRQWETVLLCKDDSHWLGVKQKLALAWHWHIFHSIIPPLFHEFMVQSSRIEVAYSVSYHCGSWLSIIMITLLWSIVLIQTVILYSLGCSDMKLLIMFSFSISVYFALLLVIGVHL